MNEDALLASLRTKLATSDVAHAADPLSMPKCLMLCNWGCAIWHDWLAKWANDVSLWDDMYENDGDATRVNPFTRHAFCLVLTGRFIAARVGVRRGG